MPGATETHLATRAERHALGKAARKRASLDSLADPVPVEGRDPLSILRQQDQHRIPFLVPERHKRMAASPFAFLRGAAAVMAADLAHLASPGLTVQAAGDAHILNFGSFISPEGRILFDVNDFDETIAGVDFTVDARRLAASLAVAGSDAGLSRKQQSRIVAGAIKAYREMMRDLGERSPYEVWQQRIDLTLELDRIGDKKLRAQIAAALGRVPIGGVLDDDAPHLDPTSPTPRFADRADTIFHGHNANTTELIADAAAAFARYPAVLLPERQMLLARYRHLDTAIKVVGVGSVGTLCAIALYATADKEMLVLQLKEAQASVNHGLVIDPTGQMTGNDEGRRVVEGQRALQAATDVFLAAVPPEPGNRSQRHFYVRHLKTRRLSTLADLIVRDIQDGDALAAYGQLCARTLARAHARTGDPIAIGAYLGSSTRFEDAVTEFACGYVKVNTADHAALKADLAPRPSSG